VERVRLEELGGKRLLVTDLSDLGPEEASAFLQQTHLTLSGLPRERTVLSLVIVHNLRMSALVTDEIKRVSRLNGPWILATALVGMSAIGRVIARGISMVTGRSFNAFAAEAEARAWLAESAAKVA
jgi:hypothetical protein